VEGIGPPWPPTGPLVVDNPRPKHPGHLATKRGWEVMSAVERERIEAKSEEQRRVQAQGRQDGKELELAFVGTHQPVRQLDERPLLRLHRFSGRRHQGPNLRHRFFGSTTRTAR